MLQSFFRPILKHQLKRQFILIASILVMTTACTESPNPPTTNSATSGTATETTNPTSKSTKINVNKAPIAELDKLELPGTKPSLSERIQGARPYKTIDDLVSKKAISAEELGLIKNLITTED
ncbi:DNA uptake protein [Synechococcus sp. PCC 7502]|uniref:ComEA family DNA-binding protein n=1 Tax=Synechococcus sp. PCC 7502 TaxID=1173263 RepID=UPI00029F9FAB|nr:helix-hairpin-helix domain-containing protein [Synechococcus sp. PCC 7502]AFY72352.1 DNA uptake protein [Synechococcus sp. PCC 7502]